MKLICSFIVPMCIVMPVRSQLWTGISLTSLAPSTSSVHSRKITKNLRYPRRPKLPPDFGVNLFLKQSDKPPADLILTDDSSAAEVKGGEEEEEEEQEQEVADGGIVWESEELEVISSLFQGRMPQKPRKLGRERSRPVPLPRKVRPLGFPSSKRLVHAASRKLAASRASVSKQVYKNPTFLLSLARDIKALSSDQDVAVVLDHWARFLRKGSLSLTIRELGHLGLPERALQIFCWAQKQPQLFPDDRILASTVEALASNNELNSSLKLENFTSLTSKGVMEAMIKGFIRGGSLNLAWKLLSVAKRDGNTLDPSIYTKLMLELSKNPEKYTHVRVLLDDLGAREALHLNQQNCADIMKVCVKLGRFDMVENLFNWFKQSGRDVSIVMYTTLIRSLYSAKKYREAMAVIWEMEASKYLFDLPAYRVAIKLFVALNDLPRAARYFSKLKESGFLPTYDIYMDMIDLYMASGRLAKCKQICREAEMAGFNLDKHTLSQIPQIER